MNSLKLGNIQFAAALWLVVLAYACTLAIGAALGPSDEYAFLPTLQAGKFFPMYGENFPYYDVSAMGRFIPLAGQEYNLVALVSNAPLAYYLFNALEFVVLVFFLFRICIALGAGRTTYFALAALLLLPGVSLAFTKLLYVDKTLATLLAISVAAHIAYTRHPSWGAALIAVIAANLAIYTKESMFVAVASYAVAHLLLARLADRRGINRLDVALIASAVVYLLAYLLWVVPKQGAVLYNDHPGGGALLIALKNAANYALLSDPIIVILVVPLAAWRAYQVIWRRSEVFPIPDAMLFSAGVYLGFYLALNIYSPYYLLPSYVFALPALAFFWARGIMGAGKLWRVLGLLSAMVMVANTAPLAIHYLSYNKYVAWNYDKTLDFLVKDIRRNDTGRRVSISLYGIDRGAGLGVYFILGEYLKFKGLSIRQFDFQSAMPNEPFSPLEGKRSPFDRDVDIDAVDPQHQYLNRRFPFSVFQPAPPKALRRGDYLVVSPQATQYFDGAMLKALEKDYRLVYRTHSALAIPQATLKNAIKYWASKSLSSKAKRGGVIANENIWAWPDYYVYVKR